MVVLIVIKVNDMNRFTFILQKISNKFRENW